MNRQKPTSPVVPAHDDERVVPDLDLLTLGIVAAAKGPVGAGTVYFKLRDQGISVSTPTVGRRLRDLEADGLLRKEGVEGRSITAEGEARLEALQREAGLQAAGRRVLGAMRLRSASDIISLLEARRPIEREVARIAALRASREDVIRLADCIVAQERAVSDGDSGVAEDIQFHEQLALTTRNPFLHAIVSLLRNHEGYSAAITMARVRSGHELGEEHWAVLKAVEQGDSTAAESAMDSHIARLIDEVEASESS